MRWNQLANEPDRAMALADILCAAALADETFDASERVVVGAMLMKVLGVSELPPEVEHHLDTLDLAGLDLEAALARLELASARDQRKLLEVVADIVKADQVIDAHERAFALRLGKALGVAEADVEAMLA